MPNIEIRPTPATSAPVPFGTADAPVPLLRPNAPRLSAEVTRLKAIEDSNHLSNFGPTNAALEAELSRRLFAGRGACVTVANATLGLMLALRRAVEANGRRGGLVVMPSFTFAAAAHAALWARLTPLLVDCDPDDWTAATAAEEAALREHGDRVAAVMPYATFGTCVDLARYDRLADAHGVGIVVDAAASLGTVATDGANFGAGSRHPVVYSMHATKAFGVGEGGVVHCSDPAVASDLRRMSGFGFGSGRSAEGPGLNAKLSEVAALAALVRLRDHDAHLDHRHRLADRYREELPDWVPQRVRGVRVAHQTMPMLVPAASTHLRDALCARLGELGVGTGRYFSPHVARQPYFARTCVVTDLSVTDAVSARVVSLPMSDTLAHDDVRRVCELARSALRDLHATTRPS